MSDANGKLGKPEGAMSAPPDAVAIIIPAHNEADRIGACLGSLRPFAAAGDRVVVVDAQSTDRTAAIASDHGAEILQSPHRARGEAVRIGYEAVSPHAAIVVLAHADMRFQPASRDALIRWATEQPTSPGAFFGHRIDDSRWRFRIIERGNSLRARLGQLPYGDQSMAVRTEAIARCGGFPQAVALEDLELALRLRRIGCWRDLRCPVLIDARHWDRGVVRTTIRNWRTVAAYCRSRTADSQETHAAAPMNSPSDNARSK